MTPKRDRLSKISQRDRRAIEQAIARGCGNKFLMEAWDLSYSTLADLKEEMLTGQRRDRKPGPKAAPVVEPTVLPADRPLESYFGPADPAVIAELVAALFPPGGSWSATECKRGHDWTIPENVRNRADGLGRECVVCERDRGVKRRAAA